MPWFVPTVLGQGVRAGAALDETDQLLRDASPGEQTPGLVGAHAFHAVAEFGIP